MNDMTTMLVDLNNIIFAQRHGRIKNPPSLAKKEKKVMESIFVFTFSAIKYAIQLTKADAVVIVTDSKNVWRRDIYPEYKANHTSSFEDPYYDECIEAAEKLFAFFQEHTCAFTLKCDRAEADDLIGFWAKEGDGKNVIFSSDHDFIQLVSDRTSLYSHKRKEYVEVEDPEYELFLKCVRGDSGDHIPSAYPNVRASKVKKAWEDDLTLLNFLETVRPDGIKVGDAISKNMSLIDLTEQPEYIKSAMRACIQQEEDKKKTYSYMGARKALFELGVNAMQGKKMVTDIGRTLSTKPIFRNT